jgi:hypothetical protein
MPTQHKVKQGECLSSVACTYGFFPDIIWNHPDNAELKQERKDPNVLLAGDVLIIPDKEIKEVAKPTEQEHKFRKKGVPEKFHLIIRDEDDQPRANLKYTLLIDGIAFRGVTAGDGSIEQSIHPEAEEARLTLHEEHESTYLLPLGHLDPISEVSGVQMRLRNLNHYNGEIDGTVNEKTELALQEFQRHCGLESTGNLDEPTRKKLEEAHGS